MMHEHIVKVLRAEGEVGILFLSWEDFHEMEIELESLTDEELDLTIENLRDELNDDFLGKLRQALDDARDTLKNENKQYGNNEADAQPTGDADPD